MKRNDFIEMKSLDEKALTQKAKSLKGEIAELVLDKNMNKLKDLKVIFKKRKDRAQILTILRQKQILNVKETK